MRSLALSSSSIITSKLLYTISNSDDGKNLLLSNNANIVGNFSPNWSCNIKNILNTKISIKPLSGLIDGKSLINLYPNESCTLLSDGTNLFIFNRSRTVVMQSINLNNNPTTGGNLDLTGLDDPEIVNIQFDFNFGISAAENLSSIISLGSSFINTGSLYNNLYVVPIPGNYSSGSSSSTSNNFINYNYVSSTNFIGTINISGFGTSKIVYKSSVASNDYYTSFCNGYFNNGSVITNFSGFRFLLNTATNRFISGAVTATGFRN